MSSKRTSDNELAVVDAALWDITAKAAKLPLYHLLGGYRDKIEAYASTVTYGSTKEILDVALKQVQDAHVSASEKERSEAPDGVVPLLNPHPPTHLDSEQVLGAVKGAWRQLRFKVIPFSSLSATRVQRSRTCTRSANGSINSASSTTGTRSAAARRSRPRRTVGLTAA